MILGKIVCPLLSVAKLYLEYETIRQVELLKMKQLDEQKCTDIWKLLENAVLKTRDSEPN